MGLGRDNDGEAGETFDVLRQVEAAVEAPFVAGEVARRVVDVDRADLARARGFASWPPRVQCPRLPQRTIAHGRPRAIQRRSACLPERAGRPDLGGVARAHQHHIGTGETSAAAAARLRWCLRAPSLPPAAWRCWTSPRRCWVRDRRASTRRHRFKLKRLSGTPGRVFVAGRNVILGGIRGSRLLLVPIRTLFPRSREAFTVFLDAGMNCSSQVENSMKRKVPETVDRVLSYFMSSCGLQNSRRFLVQYDPVAPREKCRARIP